MRCALHGLSPCPFCDDDVPDVSGGQFYERTPSGRMVPTTPEGRAPDAWICRRLCDYPPSPVPAAAGIANCARCGFAIVFNPGRLDTVPADTLKICMQCARIRPLPIES
jgi:hypothetical protein